MAPSRRSGLLTANFREVLQWLPGRECEERGGRPEEECTLGQLLALGSGAAFYEYDFGDSWPHRLELVSRQPTNSVAPPARLVADARRRPLEDSGGFPGYEEIMDASADPSHPNHTVHAACVAGITGSGGPVDAAFLDITAVNRPLSNKFYPPSWGFEKPAHA